jgi:hypothetical protein
MMKKGIHHLALWLSPASFHMNALNLCMSHVWLPMQGIPRGDSSSSKKMTKHFEANWLPTKRP